jgi:hypothetical protein
MFDRFPTEIRLHIYSCLRELALSRLIRVCKQLYEEGVDSLYANTRFVFEIFNTIFRFYNIATVQDVQTSPQMRILRNIRDLPPHFDRVRQLRFACHLDIAKADEQRTLVMQAVTRLLTSNSRSRNIDSSLFYTTTDFNRQEMALTTQKILEPLRRLRIAGNEVNMADVVRHITRA